MTPTYSPGAPLSPDYGADDQGDLIWVPVRVPKGLSGSSSPQNFYQTQEAFAMTEASAAYIPSTSWGRDATMMSSMGSLSGITASDPTMDWSACDFPMGNEFDAALELELQEYLINTPLGMGDSSDLMSSSSELFAGSDVSGAMYGLPELGLGLGNPNTFSGPHLGSPTESAWSTFDQPYSGSSSGTCSPIQSLSPITDPTLFIPQAAASPALFPPPDSSSPHPQPTICSSTKHRPHQTTSTAQSRQRPRRASPTSPREGGGGSSGNSFRCALCDKAHMDNRALSRHLWAQHPDYAARTKTKSERAHCPHCEYSGRADNLARHMKRHAR
ncbi:hypothetical protein V8F20_009812 [Naviculisporaceae sp. PSN 640]